MRAITHLKVCQSSHMAYLSTVRASFETLVERKCSKCVQIPKKKKKKKQNPELYICYQEM